MLGTLLRADGIQPSHAHSLMRVASRRAASPDSRSGGGAGGGQECGGGGLEASALRSLLVGAHQDATESGGGGRGGGGRFTPLRLVAPPFAEKAAEAEAAQEAADAVGIDILTRRWSEGGGGGGGGEGAVATAAMAEGCEVYGMLSRLWQLLPHVYDQWMPHAADALSSPHVSLTAAFTAAHASPSIRSPYGTPSGAPSGSAKAWLAVHAATTFFSRRFAVVQILAPPHLSPSHLSTSRAYASRAPLLPAALSASISAPLAPRRLLHVFCVPADLIPYSAALSTAPAVDASTGRLHLDHPATTVPPPHPTPRTGGGYGGGYGGGDGGVVSFVRLSVIHAHQLRYQRSLSYYAWLLTVAGWMPALLLLQALLGLLLNMALLLPSQPLAALPDLPNLEGGTHIAAPPLGLSALHLVLSFLLAATYLIRHGPTIIALSASASPEPHSSLPSSPHRPDRFLALDGLQRPLASLLMRCRLPPPLWLPLLHGVRRLRSWRRRLQHEVRAIALGRAAAAFPLPSEIDAEIEIDDEIDAEIRQDEISGARLSRARAGSATPGSGGGGGGNSVALVLFALVAFRSLLADGMMLLLAAQLGCGIAALQLMPALTAALPLLSALACLPPLRTAAAALVSALPSLAAAAAAALLAAHLFATVALHTMPLACGDTGGPWSCSEDHGECLEELVQQLIHSRGLQDACVHAAAAAAAAPSASAPAPPLDLPSISTSSALLLPSHATSLTPSTHSAAGGSGGGYGEGSWALPWLQLGFSFTVPLALLAVSFAAIRAATLVRRRPTPLAAPAHPPLHHSPHTPPPATAIAATTASTTASTIGPWRAYTALVCRVLSMPRAYQSPLEAHCEASLAQGAAGVPAWLPLDPPSYM